MTRTRTKPKASYLSGEKLAEYFQYLDGLRESGATNMFGAGAYLMRVYSLDMDQSGDVLERWMESFSDEPAAIRARRALGEN